MDNTYCLYNEEKIKIVEDIVRHSMSNVKLKKFPEHVVTEDIYTAKAKSIQRPGQGIMTAIWFGNPKLVEVNMLEQPYLVILGEF